MRKLLFLLPLAGLLMQACVRGEPEMVDTGHEWVTVTASSRQATRTSYEGNPDSIGDLWLGAFRASDGVFVNSVYYDEFPADGRISIKLLSNYDYRFYALCNIKGLEAGGVKVLSDGDFDALVRSDFADEEAFLAGSGAIVLPELNGFTEGLPMAASSSGSWAEISRGFSINPERLYARFKVGFTNKDASTVSYSMTYMALRDAAGELFPFSAGTVSSLVEGDFTADAAGILSGTSSDVVELYAPAAPAAGTYLEMGFKLDGDSPYRSNERTVEVAGTSYKADIIYRIRLEGDCMERNSSTFISVEGTDEGIRSHLVDEGNATWREDADISIGPAAVDLGLTSGALWADRNIGAEYDISGKGDFFAWGELATKGEFQQANYQYYVDGAYVSLGNDIAGTEYDAATRLWGLYRPSGEMWKMPSKANVQELIDECSLTVKNAGDSVKVTSGSFITPNPGLVVTGPNGNSIFFPGAGCSFLSSIKCCMFWTSTAGNSDRAGILYQSYSSSALYAKLLYNVTNSLTYRYMGTTIRPLIPDAAKLLISPGTLNISVGATKVLTVVRNNTGASVTWSSDNASVAGVDQDGTVHAYAKGTATITASAGGVSVVCTVSVRNLSESGIYIYPRSRNISVGDNAGYVIYDSWGNRISETTCSWSSSNTTVASLSADGCTATVKGLKYGQSSIGALVGGEIQLTSLLSVYAEPYFYILPNYPILKVGESITVSVGANESGGDVTWNTSDESIAVVSPKEGDTATLTAISAGRCHLHGYSAATGFYKTGHDAVRVTVID